MRIGTIAAVALAAGLLAGCHDGASSTENTLALCSHPASLDDAGPGACTIGRAALTCTLPSGGGCGCVSNGTSCDDACGPASGATCQNHCNDNEYAVACGGPPRTDASTSYASPPPGCRGVEFTPAGLVFYCCPCL